MYLMCTCSILDIEKHREAVSAHPSTARGTYACAYSIGLLFNMSDKTAKESLPSCLRVNALLLFVLLGIGVGLALGFGLRKIQPSEEAIMWIGMYILYILTCMQNPRCEHKIGRGDFLCTCVYDRL